MEAVEIPRYVDSQLQVFLWEIDEIIPVVAAFAIGMMTETLTYVIIPAFLLGKLFSKYKESHLDGILMHLAYWYGIMKLNRWHENGMVRHYEH